MSAQTNNKKNPAISILSLMGVLAFSLSTLPGMNVQQGERDLASTSADTDCDSINMSEYVRRHGEVSCKVTVNTSAGKVTARVRSKLEDTPAVDLTKKDGKGEPTKDIRTTFDLETECKDGCLDGTQTRSGGERVDNVSQLQNLNNIVIANGKNRAEKFGKDLREERERKKKVDRCDIYESGASVPADEVMSCRLEKMASLGDDKEANRYYNENVKTKLKEMVEQNDPAAAALLLELSKNSNKFIQTSSANILAFARYKTQEQQLGLQIAQLAANEDPRSKQAARQAMGQLQALKAGWGSYFQSQGYMVQQPGLFGGVQFASAIGSDLSAFQADLDNRYYQVWNQHQNLINNNGPAAPGTVNGQTQIHGDPSNPRTRYGNVSTSYQGAPGTTTPSPAWPNGQQPQLAPGQQLPRPGTGVTPMSTQNAPQANRPGKPLPGTAVTR